MNKPCAKCNRSISPKNMSRHYRYWHPEITYPFKEKARCPECRCFMADLCKNCRGLTQVERFWARVTIGSKEKCWPWTGAIYKSTGYGQVQFAGRKRSAHSVAYELSGDDFNPSLEVDHKCHNTICCNPSHLRIATHKQNLENRSGPNCNNHSSGIRGVRPVGQKWSADLKHNYEAIHIGTFNTKEQAAEAVQAKRREVFTHAL